MLSLLEALLVRGGSGNSVRELMDILERDLPVSLRDLIKEAVTPPGRFRPLLLEQDGTGSYRVDQIRVYFEHQWSPDDVLLPQTSPDRMKTDLKVNFPFYFNGDQNEPDHRLTKNIAHVRFRSDKEFKDEPTMQFVLDAIAAFGKIDVPDVHDDWVGFVHEDSRSLAVQTLRRNFENELDAEFQSFFDNLAIVGGLAFSMAGFLAVSLNRSHFLAGRRSWAFGRVRQSENPVSVNTEITDTYFFEAATIDRFSSAFTRLADVMGDLALGDVDASTRQTWSILLQNFVRSKMQTNGQFTRFSGPGPDDLVSPNFQLVTVDGRVHINQQDFDNRDDMLAQQWVQDMLSIHPGIAAQL